MRRSLGLWLAAALSVACLLPPVSSAFAADQAKGELTINTESAEIWFSVGVAVTSAPETTKLADTAGEHVADVAVIVGPCPTDEHATQREIGLRGSTWCVHVTNLQAGYGVSGTIASTGTSLKLTVNRKDPIGFPLLWSIVALVAAVLLSLLAGTFVPRLTSELRRRLYQSRDDGILGLGAWVRMAAETGLMANDNIVSRAEWARTFGPGQVRTAREELLRGAPRGGQSRRSCHPTGKPAV